MDRIEYEKKTVAAMVNLYCRHKEQNRCLCDSCKQLIEYAHHKLEHCKFGNSKSSCRKCVIHCYEPKMRDKIREVMRYSGPRMIFFHPIMALKHIWVERN